MEELFTVIGGALFVFLLIVGFGLVGAYPTKWLVNYVLSPEAITSVFGTAQIGVWKAWGLNALCSLLFKSYSSSSKKEK